MRRAYEVAIYGFYNCYMQTPLIYRGYLYNLQVNGQLTCFDALTGEVKYKESLNEAFTASGIAADGKLYFSSEEGNVCVVKAGPAVSTNC